MNIVFIPNIDTGNGRNTPYHYSIKSWTKWAKQFDDIEVIEWKDPIMDINQFPIIMQREWVFDILEYNDIDYDQVLIVDADTIIHPNCPNFFNETNHEYSAVVNNGCYEWVTRSIKGWGGGLFPNDPLVKPYNYINTGFIIANKKHKPFFNIAKDLYLNRSNEIKILRDKIQASTGQTIINFMLQKHKIKVNHMSEAYNLQDLWRKNLLHVPGPTCYWPDNLQPLFNAGYVYHFNALPPNRSGRNVNYWMERTYKELYNV